ncbi:MAG: type II secretion system F family protein [Thermodesulfobacteriota bacterium]
MIRGKGIEIVLAHLYARAKQGRPWFGGPEEEAFLRVSPLARLPLYKKIAAGIGQGRSLSEALGAIRGFPAYLARLIKAGEESGNPARALGLALEHYPLSSRFRLYIRGLFLYVLVVMLFLLGFLVFSAFQFHGIYQAIAAETFARPPGLTPLALLAQGRWVLLPAAAAVVLAVIVVRVVYRRREVGPLAVRLPLVRKNYQRLLSLELGTLYRFSLEAGLPAPRALAETAAGLGERPAALALDRALTEAERGGDLGRLLAEEPTLAGLPAVEAVGLGLDAGRELELIREHNELVHDYLSANLGRDLRTLFHWCLAGCGLLVGLAAAWVFYAVISVYTWPFY